MSAFLKSICTKLDRGTLEKMCDLMQSCDYEREIILDWLCPSGNLTVDTFRHNDRNNYLKRMKDIECRVENFIRCNDFISIDMLMTMYRQECEKKKVDKKKEV